MGARQDDTDEIVCPGCNGTGQVPLLVTRMTCPDCKGSGVVDEEDQDTGEFPVVKDEGTQGSGEGSDATTSCDEADDEAYFDDGLEFGDDEGSDPA